MARNDDEDVTAVTPPPDDEETTRVWVRDDETTDVDGTSAPLKAFLAHLRFPEGDSGLSERQIFDLPRGENLPRDARVFIGGNRPIVALLFVESDAREPTDVFPHSGRHTLSRAQTHGEPNPEVVGRTFYADGKPVTVSAEDISGVLAEDEAFPVDRHAWLIPTGGTIGMGPAPGDEGEITYLGSEHVVLVVI